MPGKTIERYGWIVVGISAATLIRLLLEPWLGERVPYTLYLPVILAAAAFRDTRAGIIAMLLGVSAGTLVIGKSANDGVYLLGLMIFCMVSVGIIGLTRQTVEWRDKAIAERQVASRQAADAQILVDELTLLLDAASKHGIYFLDVDGAVTLWSPGAMRISGWSSTEVIGRHLALFYTSADRRAGAPQRALATARERGRMRSREIRVRKDGSTFIADVTITALFDPDGGLRGFGEVVEDVTEEARAAEELQLRERQLRSIVATVPEATIVTDSNVRIVSFSRLAQSLFGYSEGDILGCDAAILLASISGEKDSTQLQFDELAELGPQRGAGRRADGTIFPIEITVGRAAVGENVQFTGFVRDLSSEVATRARVAALQAQLVHMSRVSAMGTMAATLAHELNQPLAAVESYVGAARNILRSQPHAVDEPALEQALTRASSQALRAAAIIRRTREMLDRRDIEFAHEDLTALLVEAKDLAGLGDPQHAAIVALSIEPEIGTVLVDRIQIQQVVLNLLRNAVDAVRNRPIRDVRLIAAALDAETVQITVADNGLGLSPDVQANIFDAFFSTKAGGLGVGLSICRTIVEAHDGRIWTTARTNGGTEFHFTLRRSERGVRACRNVEPSISSTMTQRYAMRSE